MVEEERQVTEDDDPISALIARASAEEEPAPKKASANGEKAGSQATGNFPIQLGSFKSKDEAEREWKRLSKKHASILGRRKPTIQKVDLGADKGIFFRLQAVLRQGKERGLQRS